MTTPNSPEGAQGPRIERGSALDDVPVAGPVRGQQMRDRVGRQVGVVIAPRFADSDGDIAQAAPRQRRHRRAACDGWS